MGDEDCGRMYECSRFVWRSRREFMATEPDNKFATKRMALLYIAKKNSDSVAKYAASIGKQWTDLCRDVGTYAISPNRPFEVASFLELSDDDLEKYAQDVGTILHVHKAPQGIIYRYKPVSLGTMNVDELAEVL